MMLDVLKKSKIDLNSPFINQTLLPYLGSKEKELFLIDKGVEFILNSDKQLREKQQQQPLCFVDLFSGSGVVSRYAKYKGFQVVANDLENYAHLLSETPIRYSLEQVEEIFKEVFQKLKISDDFLYSSELELSWNEGESYYKAVLAYLNTIKKPKNSKNNYFSTFFAPKDTFNANGKEERLYYSSENALKIDGIVEAVFGRAFSKEAKEIVLSSLFCSVLSVINNDKMTSKSYRSVIGKGNKEIKERVLSDMKLEPIVFLSSGEIQSINPRLLEEEFQSFGHKGYAEGFFLKYENLLADIVYLDPPFNQQQYSVNYSHLISICKNDKPKVENIHVGKKFESRKDLNDSNFCRKVKDRKSGKKIAELSLKRCFDNITSKYVIYSYVPNTILSIPEIVKVLSDNGSHKVSLIFKPRSVLDKSSQKDEHCVIVVKKHERQTMQEIDILTRDLISRALLPENETLDISQRFLNIFQLIEDNPSWHFIKLNLPKRYRLFKKDKFVCELTFDLMMLNNVDLDFSDEDVELIKEYTIKEEEVGFVLHLSKVKLGKLLRAKQGREVGVERDKISIDTLVGRFDTTNSEKEAEKEKVSAFDLLTKRNDTVNSESEKKRTFSLENLARQQDNSRVEKSEVKNKLSSLLASVKKANSSL